MNVVIDVNVFIAANGQASQVSDNEQLSCIEFLEQVRREGGRVSIDKSDLILEEYGRYCSHKGMPGVGDAFFKWFFLNQGYPTVCERVEITPNDDRIFAEFPNDTSLENFDKSDRKYVAVARASVFSPIIVNATDSDWHYFETALMQQGIIVRQLCPTLFDAL
jgi:hypothetical protein